MEVLLLEDVDYVLDVRIQIHYAGRDVTALADAAERQLVHHMAAGAQPVGEWPEVRAAMPSAGNQHECRCACSVELAICCRATRGWAHVCLHWPRCL